MIEISQITSATYTYNSYNGEKGSIQVSCDSQVYNVPLDPRNGGRLMDSKCTFPTCECESPCEGYKGK